MSHALKHYGQYRQSILMISMVVLASSSIVQGENLSQLKHSHEMRLEQSLQSLAQEREEFRKDFLPLSQSIRLLKTEEKVWRKKIQKQQSIQDSKMISLDDLKKEIKEDEHELTHLQEALISEFISEERASLPAHDERGEQLRKLDLSIESGELNSEKALQAQLDIVSQLVDSLQSGIGGKMAPGKALDQSGEWLQGEILDLGPEQFFFSSSIAGRLNETDHGQPQISSRHQDELTQWKVGVTITLPLDVSGGDAIKAAEVQTTFLEHVKKGGIWVYPIVAFALLAALTSLYKLLALYSTRVSAPIIGHQLAKLLKENNIEEAHRLAKKQPSSCRSMWINTIERGESHPELSEEVMSEAMMAAQPKFERGLSFIAVTAAIAPLLGLLGTVTGIIKTFQMMEVFGAGDPKPLIGGISEALITTELGLILAIPALLLHALLSRRARSLLAKMERASVALCNGLMTHQVKLSQTQQP